MHSFREPCSMLQHQEVEISSLKNLKTLNLIGERSEYIQQNDEDIEMSARHTHPGSFVKDFIAGGISSAVSETVMAPLERIKLILQVQAISHQIEKEERYKGLIDALRRIPREQGIYSFWRGNTISIIRSFPIQAFNFAFKDKLEYYFLRGVDVHSDHKKLAVANFAAGGIAGVLALSIVYPLDLARTRIAADVGAGRGACKNHPTLKSRQFNGIIDCIRKTSKSHGFLGLYQGYSISIVGIFIYRACYFGLYDTMKVVLTETSEETPFYKKWLMAQSSVAIAGIISFPFDSLRRRMMMQVGLPMEERRFRSVKECLSKTLSEEGVGALYRGALTNILRSTGGAIVLVLYDEIKAVYLRMHNNVNSK